MESLTAAFSTAASSTLVSFAHNWPYLLASIAAAALAKAFADPERISAYLRRHRRVSVISVTAIAVATPFCSCGTMAVLLGMFASSMPMAPIVAFMVASPLSSPQELFYSAGLFGWPFAAAYFLTSIAMGLAGGYMAAALESSGFLKGQHRMAPKPGCSCQAATRQASPTFAIVLGRLASGIWPAAKTLLPMFFAFSFLGNLINSLIPPGLVEALFGEGKLYGTPLAATLGLPLYVSSEASLPLARSLLDGGMSRGAVMAFLLAGSGTSVGAVTGALAIVRWRVVALVVLVLWIGAILGGWGFDAMVSILGS